MKDQVLPLGKHNQKLLSEELGASGKLSVRKIDSLNDLATMQSTWNELLQSRNSMGLGNSYELIYEVINIFSNMQDPNFGLNPKWLILIVYKNDRPVAIAPLVKVIRERKLGPITISLSCIEFIPQILERFFRFRNDMVVCKTTPDYSNEIIRWLYKNEQFDVIHFAQLPEHSPHFGLPPAKRLVASLYPVIDISSYADYDSYAKNIYSKKFKQTLRTAHNRAQRYFADVTIETAIVTPQTLEHILPVASLKIDAPTFINSGYYSFLSKLCQRLPAELILVRVGSETVGYRIYVRYKNCKYLADGFIDRDYARLELGARLTDHAIRESFEQGIEAHYEGSWDSLQTRKFATSSSKMIKSVFPGNSFIGFLAPEAVSLNNKFVLGVELE